MDWWQHVISWVLGILGGVADLLVKEEFTFKKLLARGFVGGFTGYMAVLFVQGSSIIQTNPELLGFIAGMSGYLGPVLLEMFAKKVLKITKG